MYIHLHGCIGKETGFRVAVLLGGDSITQQFEALHMNPDILVATPGRLLHLAIEMRFSMKSTRFVVFDEADR